MAPHSPCSLTASALPLALLLIAGAPAMTDQSKLGHRRFLRSLLSMLDHRHHRPASLPLVTPVHAHRGRITGSHHGSAQAAVAARARSQATTPFSSTGAAQPWVHRGHPVLLVCHRRPAMPRCASATGMPPLQPWASWPASCGPRGAQLWVAVGARQPRDGRAVLGCGC
jgi:hypothetical protein